MSELKIRGFTHKDVDDFIRIARVSFAEEWRADGLTPEDFARETRRIFRWKMIPYRLLTALMGIQWEGFVAELDGKVVGGAMYVGREGRMSLTNLMVDPAYRRRGVGQALLVRRLERLKERGFPFVTAQVLESNTASLENLKKQGFEIFNRYTVYERSLTGADESHPLPAGLTLREIRPSDRAAFKEIEAATTPAGVLRLKGSAEVQYFPSVWQRLYDRFSGFSRWIRVVETEGRVVGFLCARYQNKQKKGLILQPVVLNEHLDLLPVLLDQAAGWTKQAGRDGAAVEISERWGEFGEGWERLYRWLELTQ
jgi:ribosomal protein S18 acetylase RimI-like enzyme